jgi:heme exporter protein A
VSDRPVPAPAVEARGLTRRFGAVTALRGVDLDVAAGEALALFGPNGAGKTTLIRMLSLGLRPGSGTIRIAGFDSRSRPRAIRRRVGLISHQTLLYDRLTPAENLTFFGRLYGVDGPRRRASELLDRLGLGPRAHDPVGTLSRGYQQRVSLARALVHDPDVVLLDEPFSGLDPRAAQMLRATLEDLRGRRRTVLIATHDLRQGLELTDRWALLSKGSLTDGGPSRSTDAADLERAHFRSLAEARGPA